MIINYVKPSMIFGLLVEKQYVKHIRIQWRAQASGGGWGWGGGIMILCHVVFSILKLFEHHSQTNFPIIKTKPFKEAK